MSSLLCLPLCSRPWCYRSPVSVSQLSLGCFPVQRPLLDLSLTSVWFVFGVLVTAVVGSWVVFVLTTGFPVASGFGLLLCRLLPPNRNFVLFRSRFLSLHRLLLPSRRYSLGAGSSLSSHRFFLGAGSPRRWLSWCQSLLPLLDPLSSFWFVFGVLISVFTGSWVFFLLHTGFSPSRRLLFSFRCFLALVADFSCFPPRSWLLRSSRRQPAVWIPLVWIFELPSVVSRFWCWWL
jgi:hypothetical protein